MVSNPEQDYSSICSLLEISLIMARKYFELDRSAFNEFKPGILSITIPNLTAVGGKSHNLLTIDTDQVLTGILSIQKISDVIREHDYLAGVYDVSVLIDEPYRRVGLAKVLSIAASEFMGKKLLEENRYGIALLRVKLSIPLDYPEKMKMVAMLESIGYKGIETNVLGKEVSGAIGSNVFR